MGRFSSAVVGGLPWLAGILVTAPVLADGVYWVQGTGASSRVVRSNLDGTGPTTIVAFSEVSGPNALAVDAAGGKVYWGDGASNQSRMRRAGLDGSGPETILAWPLKSGTKGIDVDSVGAKLYWAEGAGNDSRILRVGLTGTGYQSLIGWPQVSDPKAIAVDSVGGKFYWAQGVGNNSRILRANLDGTGVETLASLVWPQVSDPTGIAVDPSGGKLYWCQKTGNSSRILRSNLDGSSPAPIVSWPDVLDPKAISLDLTSLRMYWAQGASTTTEIVRANLDGSVVATIVSWPQASDVVGLDAAVGSVAPNDVVWDPAKKSCTNSGADPTKACAVAADCGLCTLKKCSGLPANSTCTGSGTTGTCPLKQCSGTSTTCTGTGQGSCSAGQTCDFTGQTCDFVNCNTTADCTAVSAGTCTAGPPGVCLAWPNNNPAATTRSLRFTVEGPAGPSKLEAIKVTMVDLQHPKPANLPTQAPTNMTTYDTKLNSTCAGATASPNYNGHHCDVTADCDIATGTAANDGTCTGLVGCTADPTCTDPLDCTLPSNVCGRWVGKPGTFYESQGPPPSGPYKAARLQCTPYYWDWKPEGLITVVGGDIAPSSEYSVQVYGTSCMGAEAGCAAVSAPVTMYTRRSGDVEVPFNPPSSEAQPNVTDIAQLVNKIKSLAGAPVKAISQLQPNLPEMNTNINVSDIVAVVDSVKLFKYAYSGPCPCPSLSACGVLGCATDTACRNSGLSGLGAGALCVKTCAGPGPLTGEPCLDNTHCVGSGTCGSGFCRDRCGRCSP